jgi:hypothetical protein
LRQKHPQVYVELRVVDNASKPPSGKLQPATQHAIRGPAVVDERCSSDEELEGAASRTGGRALNRGSASRKRLSNTQKAEYINGYENWAAAEKLAGKKFGVNAYVAFAGLDVKFIKFLGESKTGWRGPEAREEILKKAGKRLSSRLLTTKGRSKANAFFQKAEEALILEVSWISLASTHLHVRALMVVVPSSLPCPSLPLLHLLPQYRAKRQMNVAVSTRWLKARMKALVRVHHPGDPHAEQFSASANWRYRFCKRFNLSYRKKTNSKVQPVQLRLPVILVRALTHTWI